MVARLHAVIPAAWLVTLISMGVASSGRLPHAVKSALPNSRGCCPRTVRLLVLDH